MEEEVKENMEDESCVPSYGNWDIMDDDELYCSTKTKVVVVAASTLLVFADISTDFFPKIGNKYVSLYRLITPSLMAQI